MHLPEIDKYAHLDSPLHRWDPRVKLACLSVMLLVTVLSPTWPPALACLAAALALVLLSRIPLSFVFVHLRWVLLFCLFLLIALPLTAGGEALCRVGALGVSRAGLSKATLIALRATAAVLLVFPMVGTARFHVTLKALRRLRVPRVAVQILGFSYRYVFTIFDQAARMLAAARARGLARAGALRTLKNLGSIMGMLFVRGFQRSEQLYRAMLARGYTGEVAALDDFHLRGADILKAAVVLGVSAALFVAGLPA